MRINIIIRWMCLCDWVLLAMLQGGIYICICFWLAVCNNEADMLLFLFRVM